MRFISQSLGHPRIQQLPLSVLSPLTILLEQVIMRPNQIRIDNNHIRQVLRPIGQTNSLCSPLSVIYDSIDFRVKVELHRVGERGGDVDDGLNNFMESSFGVPNPFARFCPLQQAADVSS